MKRILITGILLLLVFAAGAASSTSINYAQSGRNTTNAEKSAVLNVIVHAGNDIQLDKDSLMLFDGGIQQQIEYFRVDPTGARVVLLVDCTQNLRAEADQVLKTAQALIKELYEGDEMMIIGFNEQAEIIEDFTGDLKSLKLASAKFKRQGFPKLYDALSATIEDAFRKQLGINKRAVVLISDGYDRDSSTKYESLLTTLLDENIVIYAFQAPDRTYGGIRPRDAGPKPVDAITSLVESTGGLLFRIDKPKEVEEGTKAIIDELRQNWYTLSYTPKGVNPINARRLLIVSSNDKLQVRTKKMHPGHLVR